ncbi:MAG: glucose-6-phosphate dehydrogenase [Dehalococcoidia bacterium]
MITIVIFGITGDLSLRKLLPALFNLRCRGRLSADTRIVGFARRQRTREDFLAMLRDGVSSVGGLAGRLDEWDRFAEQITYVAGDLTKPEDYGRLDQHLRRLEGGAQDAGRIYYLSVAPALYAPCVTRLGEAGMTRPAGAGGWRRVVIEKPYGSDGPSAAALDEAVLDAFNESQVYRIDHYVGKETVQNLLYFRFLNTIFEPVWNRNYVRSVQITALESVGVEGRVDFYDQTGVIRDMFQNHLLQLLAMVAMEPPASLDAEALRNEKVKVLQAVRGITAAAAVGARYRGYSDLPGVAGGSRTATYAALRLEVENWRWQGVPFYLRSGKATEAKVTQVLMQFRRPPHLMLGLDPASEVEANYLALCLEPDEGIHLRFAAKVPGGGTLTRPVDMTFHYEGSFGGEVIPDAYEQLLDDALRGDASLFTRSDHIREAWRIVDPGVANWGAGEMPALEEYEPGARGPAGADELLARDGEVWLEGCGDH